MWNYRIVMTDIGFVISEVFYDDDEVPWVHAAAEVRGDSLSALKAEVRHIASALKMPVLTESDFRGQSPVPDRRASRAGTKAKGRRARSSKPAKRVRRKS